MKGQKAARSCSGGSVRPDRDMTVIDWTFFCHDPEFSPVPEKTRREAEFIADAYILPGIGGLRLREVRSEDLWRVLDSLSRSGVSDTELKKVRFQLSEIFGRAYHMRLIPFRPLQEAGRTPAA